MPLPPKVHKRFSWRGQLFPAGLFSKLPGWYIIISMAIPHNSKCRYGERGAADTKPKAQIILDAAKVSAASGGNSEPKQGQRSQSARGFCPRSTMQVPQPDIIEHFGNADAVPQLPERCLSRQAGIVRCCLRHFRRFRKRFRFRPPKSSPQRHIQHHHHAEAHRKKHRANV